MKAVIDALERKGYNREKIENLFKKEYKRISEQIVIDYINNTPNMLLDKYFNPTPKSSNNNLLIGFSILLIVAGGALLFK